jgi:hypothetical protein
LGVDSDASVTSDTASLKHKFFELRLVSSSAIDMFWSFEQRLDKHFAIAPIFELVLQNKLQ